MPRLKQVPRASITDSKIQAMFQEVFGDRDPTVEPGTSSGTPGNWWTMLALQPDLFHLYLHRLNWQRSSDRQMRKQLMHLMLCRSGWARGSQFVFSQHSKAMRSVGHSEEKIRSVPAWSTADCYSPLERLVLAYADDLVLCGGRVPQHRYDALRQYLSEIELIELTFITCTYASSGTFCVALRLEMDDYDDPFAKAGFDWQAINGGAHVAEA